MSTATVAKHQFGKVVSPEEWLAARNELLTLEKEFNRLRDELSAKRRELPWIKVEKNYVFEGPNGKASLADLFDGKSQLFVYHFMLGPGWAEGCKGCSMMADSFDGSVVHLAARDTTLVAISRATLPEIQAFQQRMGWKFQWYSSNANDFNFDYHVSFTKEDLARGNTLYNFRINPIPSEELPGASVFYKNEVGEVFHTYSTFARGLDTAIEVYNLLDLTPKGRDEAQLSRPMDWLRHHDKYEAAPKSGSCCSGH